MYASQETEWPGQAVAIVGAGCRLPGGIRDLEGLWDALMRGDDLVGTVPPDRFEADRYVDESIPRLNRSYTRAGGFLDDIATFDAAYFGISPKEAAAMDPQQRLMLEMAAEAFDDAGIDPVCLAGSDTGVFVGVSDPSYGALQGMEPGSVGPYTMSGSALSIVANRLSHAFDLRGSSMSIDTACSSALQAVERAFRSLADGSCQVALAGGVNVLLNPMSFVGFSQASMLSPTGRCRAFSADADGFVRAEGGGVVVLKRLTDALADGDRVHGVIVGAAANNDGHTVGLALPNAEAQEALLRQVYSSCGVSPDEVVYVEAHGTGTQAGDPAECRALGRSLGMHRAGGALPIGSVKTNLGHLEPASGMPGLFKALLVLRHRTIPPSLHATSLNPSIDFAGLGLSVVTRPQALPEAGGRVVAGVNSFGFGGANVHVALTTPPTASPAAPSLGPRGLASSDQQAAAGTSEQPVGVLPFMVSARSSTALTEAVARAAEHLESVDERDFYHVAFTAGRRRALHPHRAVVLASSAAEAALALTGLRPASNRSAPDQPTQDGAAPARVTPDRAGPDGAAPDGAVQEQVARSMAVTSPVTHATPATPVIPATPMTPATAAAAAIPKTSATPETPAAPATLTTPGTSGADIPRAVIGEVVERGRVAMVFCGNGSQWAGMGADLLSDATFRAVVEEVEAELTPRLGWSVLKELESPPEQWRLAATEIAQPLLFTVQAGLVEMLAAAGVRPGAVLGHSVGEVAAAYASGALTLSQAAQVIAERGRAQSGTRGLGRMAAVGLAEGAARQVLAPYPLLEIAAVNSDRDVTVSGPQESLRLLAQDLAAREVFFRELDVDYPFHSAAMDGAREALCTALADLRPSRARIPMVSTVTGDVLNGEELDAAYWWDNVRRPVRFAAAAERVLTDGFDVLVEVGPHPVLQSYLRRASGAARVRTAIVPTLRRPKPAQRPDTPPTTATGTDTGAATATGVEAGRAAVSRAEAGIAAVGGVEVRGAAAGGAGVVGVRRVVAQVIAAGAEIDWERYFPSPGQVRSLPAYPWQRQRHWTGEPLTWAHTIGDPAIQHPLLGQRLPTLAPAWYGEIDHVRVPWVNDHRAGGVAVMPATGYVEMALAAGRLAMPEAVAAVEVDQVVISRALAVPGPSAEQVCVQTSLSPDTGVITVASTTLRGQHPREHVRARVRPLLRPAPPPLDVAELRSRIGTPVDVPGYYARAAEGRMVWGPEFQVLTGLWTAEDEVLATYTCPQQRDERYQAHPVLLDSGLQAGVVRLVEALRSGTGYMPAAIGAVRLWRRPALDGLLYVRAISGSVEEVCWDITVADADGRVAVELEGVRLRRTPGLHATPVGRYHVELRAAPRPGERPGPWPVADPGRLLAGAADRLAAVRQAWRELGHGAYTARLEETFAHTLATALRELTEPKGGGDGERHVTVDDLFAVCAQPSHRRMLQAALPLLERHGLLTRQREPGAGLALGAREARSARSPVESLRELVAGTSFTAQTALAVRAGRHLPGLLRGEPGAAGVLTSGGAAELVEQVHDIGPVSLFGNRIARALVEQVVRQWPADRPLRILEVGAGTGGTTATLLPILPVDRTRYTVTDAAEPVLARLRQRFSEVDFVEYGLLDLNGDPAGQGQPVGGYDLVVAAGCLHLTRDVTAALRGLATLVAPSGKLLVVEPHRVEALLPYIGLMPELWDFTDLDVRPESPLLSRRRWSRLLAEIGYTDIVQAGPEDDPDEDAFSVMLASAPSIASTPLIAGEASQDAAVGGAWIVVAEDDRDPLPAALASSLEEHGAHVSVSPFGDDPSGWAARMRTSADGVTLAIVLGDAPGAGPSEAGAPGAASSEGAVSSEKEPFEKESFEGESSEADTAEAVVGQITRRAALLRSIALACEELPPDLRITLWLVSRPCGALPEPAGEPLHPQDAATWGTARSLANEQPRLEIRRLCLHRTPGDGHDVARLAAELLTPGDEDEILLTRQGRFVPRLVRTPPPTAPTPIGQGAFRLTVSDPGLTYRLAWEQTDVPAPGPGQALVEVGAVGLNYRDVMFAVNLLPTEAVEAVFGGHELGLECAGIVVEVGPEVTRLKPGDRVMAPGPVGFGSHAVIDAGAASHVPAGLTFAQATTLPMAFSTVYHSLHHCARVKPGETVLVHGGAGGVGLAALEYARLAGIRVIATAGTPAKRDLLRALGVDHVLDSRSVHFAEQVRELTGGRGVDVVLNSLAGEAISRGLECLGHGGRFIELGKRDIYESGHLPLRPFGDNISFFGVDVGTLMWKSPALTAEHAAAFSGFDGLRPLPHTVHPAERVADAFTLMRHSRHIGKVVVTFDPRDEPVMARTRPVRPHREGTYLITGGLTGFGAATARHLARAGVRHLALVGRRGADTPEAPALLEELKDLGAQAGVYAADVADRAAIRAILRELDEDGHPVRGVVHAAMRLDDAALADLTDDRIRAVLRPKIAGALILDELTADLPLEAFVLYSSLTTIGNIGQAPYVSANLFLEALARRRRAQGRPALAVCLGALAGTGVLAHGTQAEALAKLGIESLTTGQALAAMDDMLGERADVAIVGRCDWIRMRQALPGLRRPWLSAVLPPGTEHDLDTGDLLARLGAMSGEEAHAYVAEQLTALLSTVLLTPAAEIDPDRRLDEYGMDSLMATDLLVSMRTQFGVDIPPMELIRGTGTITDITRTVLLHLGLKDPS
ncbi:Alcohol dehydrogenase GroES-like domain-containing protein [Nonomuraea solani]|uniref:Alcohol dehydrogenase GroES-like domain-containing protein n=1 Tax=Nonomuraea solani TaxID=1144553 RepID=A0A1H6F285_9ACTN|nr:type I polyketide synthase [Nonomuraea solani]SEH03195.1 Alcohol dehydrogenase GroES-like domain-containing protein [Nonomuraea solani]